MLEYDQASQRQQHLIPQLETDCDYHVLVVSKICCHRMRLAKANQVLLDDWSISVCGSLWHDYYQVGENLFKFCLAHDFVLVRATIKISSIVI